MGQAKNRGTREERIAQAQAAGRQAGAPERTKPYAFKMPLSTPGLDRLWPLFKPFAKSDKTIAEIREEARAQHAAMQEQIKQRAELAERGRLADLANAALMAQQRGESVDVVIDEVSQVNLGTGGTVTFPEREIILPEGVAITGIDNV